MGFGCWIEKLARHGDVYITPSMTKEKVIATLNEERWDNDARERNEIESWCSAGGHWFDFVCSELKHDYVASLGGTDYIVIQNEHDFAKLRNSAGHLMGLMYPKFAEVWYGITDMDEENRCFTCINLEGVMLKVYNDDEHSSMYERFSGDERYLLHTDYDEDKFCADWQFVMAILGLDNIDWENEFLIIGGGW